jgi:hypothetical protein
LNHEVDFAPRQADVAQFAIAQGVKLSGRSSALAPLPKASPYGGRGAEHRCYRGERLLHCAAQQFRAHFLGAADNSVHDRHPLRGGENGIINGVEAIVLAG